MAKPIQWTQARALEIGVVDAERRSLVLAVGVVLLVVLVLLVLLVQTTGS